MKKEKDLNKNYDLKKTTWWPQRKLILTTNETKVELLGKFLFHYIRCSDITTLKNKIKMLKVMHSGGSYMDCGCFAVSLKNCHNR